MVLTICFWYYDYDDDDDVDSYVAAITLPQKKNLQYRVTWKKMMSQRMPEFVEAMHLLQYLVDS